MATGAGNKWRGDGDDEEARRVSLLNADVRKEDWQVAAAPGGGGADEKPLGRRVWEESEKLWVIVAPAIFSRVVTFSMNVITQAFAGHLGDLELAAISIANTVVVGFNFGLMVRTHARRPPHVYPCRVCCCCRRRPWLPA
jgi:MATE family multidrug resistance protein